MTLYMYIIIIITNVTITGRLHNWNNYNYYNYVSGKIELFDTFVNNYSVICNKSKLNLVYEWTSKIFALLCSLTI